MVIFEFKEEGIGTEHVTIATSKCVPSGIFLGVQHSCQVSIALLDYWWSHPTVLAQPMTSSVTKFP